MSSPDSSASTRLRLLVVEDEYLVADYIAGILEDLGYEVMGPVPTIPGAIDIIAVEEVHAVLLDANLDGTSSAPVAAELLARRVPFVVVTGYGNLELAPVLQSAPRVTKPFTPEDIAAALAKTVISQGT